MQSRRLKGGSDMDAGTKKRLKRELAKARKRKKYLSQERESTTDLGARLQWGGRIYAVDVEIESLLHRLTQEG